MSFCDKLTGFISKKLGIQKIDSQILEIKGQITSLDERLSQLEERSKEVSRAIATLAIAHASLIRDLSDVISQHEKKKSEKKIVTSKTGDDFTN